MKVLLFNGSPKANGCTYTALTEIANVLEKEGIETEIFQIGSKAVRGCVGCGLCSQNEDHHCAYNEDCVNEAIDKLKTADGFVFGSPVHFAGASGFITAFLDRLFLAGSSYLAYKPAACVASARRAGTTATLDQLNKYLGIRNMPIISGSYWNMVHGSCPEDVQKDLEGLQTMRNVGQNMAWILKCIEAGKENGIGKPVAVSGAKTNFIQ
ncbi:flavodoxin family protein [[Clostridium] polysaccharolyticum]|uniref:Multimeric flavodoxin WrbA n=1 Tax=[Clostridium] polysaccharolyticum TaxID=29364 RepID=A0A1I0DJZ6_9FIRM|nr:flavodoxin family protein [[Clostridium] polysaccharolyticum]SET32793.1 Multimeric flavodoxin WrbA [[Clostridium] polysaccharolyticum]